MKVNRNFEGKYLLHFHGWRIREARNEHEEDTKLILVSYLSCSSTMKIGATYSSETLVDYLSIYLFINGSAVLFWTFSDFSVL
jgi:hypothetical protein